MTDIIDTERGYSVSIPATTPGRQAVSIQTGKRGGVYLMHAESPDLSELYFEERRFLFVDGPARTYRIVHDPRSPLNEHVFASLQIDGLP